MTRSELNHLDLATINAAQSVIVAAIEHQICKWEQDCADASADGRLINALQLEHWAFAAQLLRSITSSELSALFAQVADIQFSSMPPVQEIEVLAEVA
ncbi:hypothetical protein [Synechococcus sp. CBW1004]|uniref:hypothetical protein n=1 Tax=Synechococcus sp. CBW1004 TaxID=1353136 RepID=UPI0018CE835D|nr:hypothetical protein [Synechococcus sp. CBW1004]QPN64483.1 hypothetical protein H8F25_07015 [Synechococcus sp. CBW1004]